MPGANARIVRCTDFALTAKERSHSSSSQSSTDPSCTTAATLASTSTVPTLSQLGDRPTIAHVEQGGRDLKIHQVGETIGYDVRSDHEGPLFGEGARDRLSDAAPAPVTNAFLSASRCATLLVLSLADLASALAGHQTPLPKNVCTPRARSSQIAGDLPLAPAS